MGVYFLLLHFWLMLGSSLGFLRGLSVLFSVATIPVIYALGARLFGRNAGLIAAWLLAINAFHIRYAQEIRGYAMVALLCDAGDLAARPQSAGAFLRGAGRPIRPHAR